MNVFYIIALALSASLVLFLTYYVYKKRQGDQTSRISIYITAIGVIVSVILGLFNTPSSNRNNAEATSDVTITSENSSDVNNEYTYPFTDSPIKGDSTANSTTDVISSDIQNNHEDNSASSLNNNTSNDSTPAEADYSNEKTESVEINKDNEATIAQKQYVSTRLFEFKTVSHDGSYKREDITSDPRGNTYNDAYVFYGEYFTLNTGGGKYDRPFFEKYIGGNYDEFTAVIIPHDTFDKYNKNIEAVIKIYADDSLIYTSDKISRKTEQIQVSLHISGIKYLKIELNPVTDLTSYYNQYSIIIYDAMLIAH